MSSSNRRGDISNNKRSPSVLFVVGNTYTKIPKAKAKLNRKGTLYKVHDWTLFVDVIQGDSGLIEKVEFHLDGSFQPPLFTCSNPVNVVLPDGSRVKRFKTRQQSTGALVPKIRIVGVGGSSLQVRHPIAIQPGGKRDKPQRFYLKKNNANGQQIMTKKKKALVMKPLPENRTFGVELELTCERGSSKEDIGRTIQSRVGFPVTVVEAYSEAHNPVSGWKIVHDGSIQCNRESPNCSKFELVSPILRGNQGLEACDKVLKALKESSNTSISVNHSMGFHCHISVENITLQQLKKICQNFVKYEDAIDSFMPASRRKNRYCQSCKAAILTPDGVLASSNAERHRAIEACTTAEALCKLMNPKGRYYKMNLQNLVTGRQPTIEFRQHSATANASKVNAWIRFCLMFVDNSARLAPPSFLKNSRGAGEQFLFLFDYVIKDRALQRVFVERLARMVAQDGSTPATRRPVRVPARDRQPCCGGCASGGACVGSG